MARTVNISFWNNTSEVLTRQTYNTNGTWTTAPPANIPATTSGDVGINPYNWSVEGTGPSNNASGSVSYTIGSSGQLLTMSWTSMDGKVNGYSISASAGYSVTASGTDGSSAKATYIFNPLSSTEVEDNDGDDEDDGAE